MLCNFSNRLTCLKLVNCGIESVEIDENENLFLSLKHLDLKTNRLNSWKDIANLNKLPALEELIVRDNPLFEDMNFDYTFNFVLSIVGRLKYLNRQQVSLMVLPILFSCFHVISCLFLKLSCFTDYR